MFYTLDFNANQKALVALQAEDTPQTGQYYQLCGSFETSPALSAYRIFYAMEVLPLSP
ncbi:MAG: hypothetical protein IT310_06530 [Anaerolineales bacterium]|nr:hypothetical protein [Anaerolineales bacterium]